jgi:hypothetical protein
MRLVVRVDECSRSHVKLALLVNGGLVSGPCGITIRVAELVDLILRIKPDEIEADREMLTEDVFHRICGFKETRFY